MRVVPRKMTLKDWEEELLAERKETKLTANTTQWRLDPDAGVYYPNSKTNRKLPPGYYEINSDPNGRIFFKPIPARGDTLLQFPDSAAKTVADGITDFWSREKIFREYGLPFKRGILLYGPAGMGKTSTLQIIAREVISHGGIVLDYHVNLFSYGYRALRAIQPDTPLVVFIEDIELYENKDTINGANTTSAFLNMLDGAENIDRVVFLATTNHPDRLSARIINRPSRFDVTIEVPYPGKEMRTIYLSSLGGDIDTERYARDTEGMSFAHIKELFISTVILGNEYTETLARLKAMSLAFHKPSDQPSANGLQGQYL